MSIQNAGVGFWWHVVWVTRGAWPVTDERGDWSELSGLYSDLERRGVAFETSDPLPKRWQARNIPDTAVRLPPTALEALAGHLGSLAQHDRIAGDTPVLAIALTPVSVQMLLKCPSELFRQCVGRLKSRSATLLSFDVGSTVGGPRTWSRGFWWARIAEDVALDEVSGFFGRPVVRSRVLEKRSNRMEGAT